MFEELAATQPAMARRLATELSDGTFAQASLFAGSRYSGRMTAALEAGRILSCSSEGRKGQEHCSCPSCKAFRTLENTNLVIVSSRDHQSVIETAMQNFQRLRNDSSRLFLLRSVRTMLLQYHGVLLDQGGQKNQTAYDAAAQSGELLLELSDLPADISQSAADKLVKSLRTALRPLFIASKRASSVSIAQVRAIQDWSDMTSMDNAPKIAIIESIDQATEGARNSLLKMLEEPQPNIWYILLTEYPGRIMQTILSRVRKYFFPAIDEAGRARLLRDVFFVDPSQFDTLESYFLSGGGVDSAQASRLARQFLDGVSGKTRYSLEDLAGFASWVDETGQISYVFRLILQELEQVYLQEKISSEKAKGVSDIMGETLNQAMVYNQNHRLAIEGMYYRLMEKINE